jgi:hypothetical protein
MGSSSNARLVGSVLEPVLVDGLTVKNVTWLGFAFWIMTAAMLVGLWLAWMTR